MYQTDRRAVVQQSSQIILQHMAFYTSNVHYTLHQSIKMFAWEMVGWHRCRTRAHGIDATALSRFPALYTPPPRTLPAGALHRLRQRSGRDGCHAVSPSVGDTGLPQIRSLALQVSILRAAFYTCSGYLVHAVQSGCQKSDTCSAFPPHRLLTGQNAGAHL